MNKVKLLYVAVFVIFGFQGKAQGNYKLMDWKTEFTVRTCLLQQLHEQYDLRREKISTALSSKDDMLEYRDECRRKYRQLLGEFPLKTSLNPRITTTHDLDGYRIENIIFESRPGHHVTTNFYIPSGKGPFPAALLFCGHEMTSKATESYQKTAALFAKNGFAVLVVDPISQGERVQFVDSNGKRILRGSTTEHTLLNAGANLVGTNVVTYELVDNVRSLDYLNSRPEVDSTRIGVLGNSGGGAQTAYFVGFDDRVKVAAPCSNIASRELNYQLDGTGDGCQQLPFEGEEQLEIGDFLIMFAPKPVLVLAGRYDFVNYTGTKQTANELESVYSVLGEPEKAELFTFDDGHGISKPKREAAVRWFRRWLCNDDSPVVEPGMEILSEAELNCTANGQVCSMFPEELTVQQMNMDRANELTANRKLFAEKNDLSGFQNKIKELLAIDDERKNVDAELIGEESKPGFILKKYILRTEGEIPLPCLFYLPSKEIKNGLKIFLYEEGKSVLASNDSLINANMADGTVLIMADLRGMGETQEKEEANEWKYYNREYHNATISLFLGKPIVGQRVSDLFTLLDFVETQKVLNKLPVHIYASGAAAPVAVYAALFREQLKSVTQINSIRTYFDILQKPMELDWYSYVVPDVLKYFDLPDLSNLRSDLKIACQGEKVSTKKPYQK